jgi:TRAP-type transport system small permease protein
VLRSTLRRGFEQTLEWIVIVLMVALAVVVTAGVIFRYTGNALVWYDEVASILLAWVTYYGAALAALKRANLGVPEIVRMLAPPTRVLVTLVAEGFVFVFFIILAWVGYTVLEVLAGDTLVSLPAVSVAWAQSVIPVSSMLFIIAEALAMPQILREARQT